ncbi:MAG: acyltransferase family protein [Firmicutes bacterium]|nr:acyltransferase family protein [Bacillota bacterium]
MKNRILKYDIVRITAILLVVMVHVSAYLVIYYPDTSGITFQTANIFNGIGRAGVPLFLLLSGALLLNEDKPFDARRFYKKSFGGICLLLIFRMLFYAAWRGIELPILKGDKPDIMVFVDYLIRLNGDYPHLWYLQMLVGTYLAVPVLRLFVKKENKNYILGFIIVAFIAQIITNTLNVFTIDTEYTIKDFVTRYHFEYATGYIPFLLIGWYLETFPPKHIAAFTAAGIAALILIILVVQFCIDDIPNLRGYVSGVNNLPGIIYGIGIFVFINAL